MSKQEPINRNEFNEYILKKTYEYQKKHGFKIGTGAYATWNNEADAFKHAYMQAYLSLRYGETVSKFLGDFHELEGYKAPREERNMDLWNNSIGREVAYEIKKQLGSDIKYYSKEFVYDMAAKKILKLMKKGELIVTPEDRRLYKNMRFERLRAEDRIFYKGELKGYNGDDKEKLTEYYLMQGIENRGNFQSKSSLNAKVISGELIYVDNYTRADGTKVSGYYRRKLVR